MTTHPRLLPVLLAALAAIGPFSIDTYLPAFGSIARELGATQLQVQQTLTCYLVPFALMILWHGALSDALGRRAVILVTLFLYALASIVCALAGSIEMLFVGRALQGISAGSGISVGRAVIRDVLPGPEAQKLMAQVAMIFAAAPAIAPIVGGWIYAWLGWRAVFGLLVIYGFVMCALCYLYLRETLPRHERQSLQPLWLARSYLGVFKRAEFLVLAGALAFNFNGFFLYVLAAPVFLMQHLGISAQGFAVLFVPSVLGLMIGSFVSGRLAGRVSARRTILFGYAVMAAAAALNFAVNALWPPGLPQAVAPIMLYSLGNAIAMPSLTLLVLDLLPAQRGLISSCQSFVQVLMNALTASTMAPLLWGSTLSLALGMAGFLACGTLAFVGYLSVIGRGGAMPTR